MQVSKFLYLIIVLLLAVVACSSETGSDQAQHARSAAPADSASNGAAIYRKYCVTCHGADGKLGLNGAGDLTQSTLSLDARILQISKGKNMMAAYEEVLTPKEIKAVAEYTLTLKKK